MQSLRNYKLQFIIGGLLIGACLLAFLASHGAAPAQAGNTLHGAAAVEQLKQDGSYAALAEAISATRYQVNQQDGAWRAANPAQRLNAQFTPAQVRIAETAAAKPQWQFGVKLSGYGYGAELSPVSEGEITSNGNRVEIRKAQISNSKSEITEWYVNKPEGLEQGFTLNAPPSPSSHLKSPLRLALQLTGDLHAASTNKQSITLQDNQGRTLLSYDHLAAWDADHKPLPATMKADGQTITLEVEDAGAVYPVTIDPLIAQQQKLSAADGAGGDRLGESVALSGNTALVGALGDEAFRGAAYVFVRSGSVWAQQAKLNGVDSVAGDQFGIAVALNGNTAVIGAYKADINGNQNQGAAYVFVRNGASWSQQQKLVAGAGAANDDFGAAVAVNGDTAVIGAPTHDSNGVQDQGAAYVFVRSGAVWNQQAKLTAADGALLDDFGNAVALDSNTAVIGAYRDDGNGIQDQGSAYVFVRNGVAWSQQAKLTAADGGLSDYFGYTVAISGDTALIGAESDDVGAHNQQGSAYVFTRSGANWSQQQKLLAADGGNGHNFGNAVALSGDLAVIGAASVNQAYVFARNGANWSQQQKLTAADSAAGDRFGNSVALSGDTVLAGAQLANVGLNGDQGAAYVFTVCGELAQQQALNNPEPAADDYFGARLAVSGDTAVVGATGDTINGNLSQGSVYVFVRNGAAWSQQQKLTASNGAASDRFGLAVGISGNTVVVGAPYHKVGANTQQGSAYVFVRNGVTWSQEAILVANDGALNDLFGYSLAVSGETAVLGAPSDAINANQHQGSAYVFVRNGATWSQQAKLLAADGAADEYLGFAVALDGNTAVIGANSATINGKNNQGAAYVFTRTGAAWSQQQKLTAADGQADDAFGNALALSNNMAVIAASNASFNKGAVYVFAYNGATWSQQQKLTAADGTTGEYFGYAVALAGNRLAVGSTYADIGNQMNQGAAYVFGSNGATWSQQQKLTAADGATNHFFGTGVALPSNAVLVSASKAQVAGVAAGKVYVFDCLSCPAIALTPATLPGGTVSTTYNQTVTASGGAGPYQYSCSGGTLPPGLSLSSGGLLSGTLTTFGTYNFTITALQGNLCSGSQSYSIAIAPNCQTITITPVSLPSGTVGSGGYNQPLGASGGGAPYSFSLMPGEALPPGLSLVNSAIVGGAQQGGVFNFTIKATDAQGCVGMRAYSFTATCQTLNVFPAILPAMTVGAPYSQGLSAAGSDGPYTYSTINTLPSGLTLSAAGLLSGTPTMKSSGLNFDVIVTDVYGCFTTKNYSYTIGCPALNINPSSLPNGATGQVYNQSITATGGIAPYGYSVTAGTLPQGLALSASGALTGTPTQAGAFNFTVTASFGGGCVGFQSYALTITQSCATLGLNPASLPGGTVGVAYNASFNADGGTAPYNYSVGAGSLPPGLSLSAAGALSGTPAQTGTANFSILATDANGCTGLRNYVLTINQNCPALNVTPATVPTVFLNVPYSQQLTANGGVGPHTFSLIGGLPQGLTLSPAGLLSGTVAVGAGQTGIQVVVTDANGCTGQQAYTLNVTGCPALTLTPASLPAGTTGVAYSQQLTASGGVAPYSFSVIVGALPTGLTLSTTGLLSGTPTQTSGVNLTIRATDANGCAGTQVYALTVNCATVTVNPATLPNGTTGAVYNQTLTQTGGAGTVTFSLSNGTLPTGLSLSNAGVLSGTPTQAGSFPITVTATDAAGCGGSRNYTLTINGNCPTLTVNPATLPAGQMGAAYNQTITATGGTAPYAYTVSVGALPNGITLTTAGVLSGTPTVSGQFGFTVTATDANGCAGTRSYVLTTNGCPTVTVNPATLPNGTLGAVYNQTLTASGGAGPYVYSLQNGAWPTGVTLSGAGAVTGTPTANGTFNVTVKATDANGCMGTRTYTLNVSATCPTITVNPATLPGGFAGTAYNQVITATGGGAPYTFTVDAGVLPNGLTLSLAGVLSGTPTQAGSFGFTIKATDGQGCMGTRAYTVNFNGAGLMFYPLPFPLRLLDTRAGMQGCDTPGAPIAGGSSRTQLARRTCNSVTIPANALAVTGNVTTVQSGGGYLTLYPSNAGQPLVANTNFAPNEILNNVFTVGLGNDGAFKIFATSDTDVVVDVTGYYAPPSAPGLYFHPLPQPLRLLETRAGFTGCFTPGAPLTGNADTLQMGVTTCNGVTIPNTARALVGNATTVSPQGAGYLTLFPADAARPLAASSNFAAGQVMSAPFTVGLSVAGAFKIFTTAQTDLVIDVSGYYSTEASDVNGAGLLFNPLPAPVRLLDTRAGQAGCFTPGAPLAAATPYTQTATGACVNIPATARGIVGNATVVNAQAGYLTFWPSNAAQPLVAASNFTAGQVFNRHFTVGLGADGAFKLFAAAPTDLVLDVAGYFAP